MNNECERDFLLEIGPPSSAGEWLLRVAALEEFSDEEQERWMQLIEEAFINLATVGGLCGLEGNPESSGAAEVVEVQAGTAELEWKLGKMAIDSCSVSLLANLCEWAAYEIAPISLVQIIPGSNDQRLESADRPLPRQSKHLSFDIELAEFENDALQLQVEFETPLSGKQISHISHLLKPWHCAVFSRGFALTHLPIELCEVRAGDPPLTIVDNLWCWNFDMFVARKEAVHVLANILERIHRQVSPVALLTSD